MAPGYVITAFEVSAPRTGNADLRYQDADGDWRVREFLLAGRALADDDRAAVCEITYDGFLEEVYVGLARHGEQPLFATPATLAEVIRRDAQAAMDAREVAHGYNARTVPCPVCGATLTPSFQFGDLESTVTLSGVTLNCGGCVKATLLLRDCIEQAFVDHGRRHIDRMCGEVAHG